MTTYDNDTRRLSLRVIVDGITLENVFDASWHFGIGQVPTATIVVRGIVGDTSDTQPVGDIGVESAVQSVAYHDPVTIDAGFDGVYERVFTGVVLDITNTEGDISIECVGQSWVLDVEYHTTTVTLSNVDATDAVTQLLEAAGLVSYFVDLPPWQLAVTKDRPLSFQTYSDAIQKVSESLLARWFETPSGQVVVREAQPVPGVVVSRTYFAMRLAGLVETYPDGITSGRPRLNRVKKSTAIREVKNEILVLGSTIQTTDVGGNAVSARITSLVTGPNQLVLAPNAGQALNALVFSNELIETQAKADEVAVNLFTLHSRLTTYVSATIDGDPRCRLGETLGIEDPQYTGTTGRFWLESYDTRASSTGFSTSLSLVGKEGARTNWEPVADFIVSIDREWIADRFWLVATFDGRVSYDFDGTVVAYSWADNQGNIVSGTDPIVMVRVDPATLAGTWNVTLTVTDNDGAIRSVTKPVSVSQTAPNVKVPGLCLAFDVGSACSPDGGQFWYDRPQAGIISAAASLSTPGRAVFGTSGGAIYRTIDLNVTVPLVVMAAVGSPIVDIEWDRANGARVWAITRDCRVFLSLDFGATWALQANLGNGSRFLNRIDSVFIGQSLCLRVYGGTGTGRPYLAWTIAPSPVWTEFALGGELLADLLAAGTDATLYAVDGASDVSPELAILLNSAGFNPALYFNADVFGNGSGWTRATGAPVKSRGRWIDSDLEQGKFAFAFDDTVIYLADEAGGVLAVTTAAAALAAGDAPNHGLWLGRPLPGLSGVYAVAAEGAADGTLYKTWDRFATIGKTRPATGATAPPAGANAKMIAVGAKLVSAPRNGALYAQQSPFTTTQQTYSDRIAALVRGSWQLVYDPVAALKWPISFVRSLNGIMFRSRGPNAGGGGQKHPGNLERSDDQGATWTEVFAMQTNAGDHWGVQAIDAAASGRLYLCCMADDPTNMTLPAPAIYYSEDQGVTWTLSFEDTTLDAGNRRQMIDITCRPFSPPTVFVIGGTGAGARRSWNTVNDGVAWNFVVDGAPTTVASCERQCVLLSSGRVVLMDGDVGTMRYSDDFGATWVTSNPSPRNTGRRTAVTVDQVDAAGQPGNQSWEPNGSLVARLSAQDGSALSVSGSGTGGVPGSAASRVLQLRNMGFVIPAGATITGIEVRIYKWRGAASAFPDDNKDILVKLRSSAGVVIGNDKSSPLVWPASGAYTVYGGPGDLWGYAGVTPADVNNAQFGLHFQARPTRNQPIFVDHIDMLVYYTQGNDFATQAKTLIRNAAGSIVWAAGGSATAPVLNRSADFGLSWQLQLDETRLAEQLGAASIADEFGGLALDPTRDVLYVSTDVNNAGTQRVLSIAAASTSLIGTVNDQTVNLNSLFASATAAHRRIARQGIVVL